MYVNRYWKSIVDLIDNADEHMAVDRELSVTPEGTSIVHRAPDGILCYCLPHVANFPVNPVTDANDDETLDSTHVADADDP